jgi:hypothetical protein
VNVKDKQRSGQPSTLADPVQDIAAALHANREHVVAQWLRHCTTNQKVAGSIPDGVIGIFH